MQAHLWFWHSTLACSTRVLASEVRPLVAQPKCSSISMIFSTLEGTFFGSERNRRDRRGCEQVRRRSKSEREREREGGRRHESRRPIQRKGSLTSRVEVSLFSTASTTPSLVRIPIAVVPSRAFVRSFNGVFVITPRERRTKGREVSEHCASLG